MVRMVALALLVFGCGHKRERWEVVADYEAKVKQACACTTLACFEAAGTAEEDDFDTGILDDDSYRYVQAILQAAKCKLALKP